MGNDGRGNNWEQIRNNETRKVKLNLMHMRQETITIEQET